jgi:hypothetical protein
MTTLLQVLGSMSTLPRGPPEVKNKLVFYGLGSGERS